MYCPKCGSANNYTLNKPKFCQSCGVKIAIASFGENQNNEKPTITNDPPKNKYIDAIAVEKDEIDETGGYVPKIDKLDVEIDIDRPRGIKLGQAIGTARKGIKSEDLIRDKPRSKKINNKKFLEEFKREAGGFSSRDNPIVIGDDKPE